MLVEELSQDKHSDNLIKFENLALRSAGADCMTKPAGLRFRGKLFGVTVGGGLEKLSQGRKFFFLISAPAQLSAYANHEFKIIPTPTQLSAYANHGLEK